MTTDIFGGDRIRDYPPIQRDNAAIWDAKETPSGAQARADAAREAAQAYTDVEVARAVKAGAVQMVGDYDAARAYATLEGVFHPPTGASWYAKEPTVAGEEPNVSPKWNRYNEGINKATADAAYRRVLQVTDPAFAGGADPTGVANSTAAFNAWIAQLKTLTTAGNSVTSRGAPLGVIPEGDYLIDPLAVVDFAGLDIEGDGDGATLVLNGTGPHLIFGVFDATPTSWWYGTAGDYRVANLRVRTGQEAHDLEGTRTRSFIQDNGCGGGILSRLDVQGCKVGFEATSGSDFTRFDNLCWFMRCDIGVYLGIASEQVDVSTVNFAVNREGLVADWAPQGAIRSCWTQDNSVADFVFTTRNLTRLGQDPATAPGESNEMAWGLTDLWIESDAGYRTTVVSPPRHIHLIGEAVGPRGVNLDRIYVAAGAPGSGTDALIEVEGPGEVSLGRAKSRGTGLKHWLKANGGTPVAVVANASGTIATAAADRFSVVNAGSIANCVWRDDGKRKVGVFSGAGAVLAEWGRFDTDEGAVQFLRRGDGLLGLAFSFSGSWLERVQIDVQNRKIIWEGDTEVRRATTNVLGTGTDDGFRTGVFTTAARPSAVSFGVGTQVYDSTLSKPIWSDGTNWRDAAGTVV